MMSEHKNQKSLLTQSIMYLTGIMFMVSFLYLPAASQAENVNIMFILDASGSMWGQVQGRTKIEIARESLEEIIQGLPDDVNVGLIAYGHRRKGDCDDVELITPIGPIDKQNLINKINNLNPKGKTPITLSINKAAEALRVIEETSSVILISDGKETCEGDPCAAMKKLKQSGVKFVMNVIGFDVSGEERKQLECIARAGGGKYFSADNAGDFKFATKAVTETKKKPAATGDGKVWFDEPAEFAPGTRFQVHFEADSGFHEDAWIGVVPSDIQHGSEEINDRHETCYEYIKGRKSGFIELTAPGQPGKYDVRMHDSDHNGREVAHVSFAVKAKQGELNLDKTEFAAGENIFVRFSVPSVPAKDAWAGIIPSDILHGSEEVNDKHDIDYKYLGGKTQGMLEMRAPAQPGEYDVRMHDTNNGSEIASVSFTVSTATGELNMDKKEAAAGSQIQVRFTVSSSLPKAWAGIIPSDVPHGSEEINDKHDVAYKYLGGKTQGILEMRAPAQPGEYDVRMHDTNKGSELASISFTVSLAEAELKMHKNEVGPGEDIYVRFTVSSSLPKAWAGIIPSDVPHGSEKINDKHDISYKYLSGKTQGMLEMKAPDNPGSYDVRLNDMNGGNEIASVSFKVVSGP